MYDNRTKPPLWHRVSSVVGLVVLTAIIAYHWFDGLSQYATDRPLHQIAVAIYDSLHEAAIHTSDTVSLGDLAIFAVLLVVARVFYAAVIDPEQRRRDKKRLRLAYEFVRPTPLSDKADMALSERRVVDYARNRPPI